MTAVDRLLKTLEARGLGVAAGPEPGTLVLTGPKGEKTPAVLEAVKAFKPQLVERFPAKPVEKPTGPPDGAWTGEDWTVMRGGVCRSRADATLCWAKYRAGGWYWFEELRMPSGRGAVASFRVFAGTDAGFAGPTKFAEMFEEEPAP
jgi:hypothetical protein